MNRSVTVDSQLHNFEGRILLKLSEQEKLILPTLIKYSTEKPSDPYVQ